MSSDYVVLFFTRHTKGIEEPEMCLWTLTASFAYDALGYMLYGWGAQTQAKWLVIAVGLGAMIAQQVSACTIATAYTMERFSGVAGELVIILAMCSSMINFAISYSVQPFVNTTGFGRPFLFYGMCVLASIRGGGVLMVHGKDWRMKCAARYRRYVNETTAGVSVSKRARLICV